MNIQSITFSYAISFLQQSVQHPLTRQQKRILLIASAALTLLTACYIFKCCCFKVIPLNGPGKLTKEGKVYEGSFKNGKLNGKGTITHSNGMKEKGEFKDDQFEGPGKVIANDGTVMVEGTFTNGKLAGHAKIVFSNNDEYEGEFLYGVPHGIGKFKEADGVIYEGEYQAGKKHGKGKITEIDGTVKDVEYTEGNRKAEEKEAVEA